MPTKKILQTYDENILQTLNTHAKHRGITTQELVRSIIVPEWIKANPIDKK